MAREQKGQSFDTNPRSAEFSYHAEEPPPRKDSNLFALDGLHPAADRFCDLLLGLQLLRLWSSGKAV